MELTTQPSTRSPFLPEHAQGLIGVGKDITCHNFSVHMFILAVPLGMVNPVGLGGLGDMVHNLQGWTFPESVPDLQIW